MGTVRVKIKPPGIGPQALVLGRAPFRVPMFDPQPNVWGTSLGLKGSQKENVSQETNHLNGAPILRHTLFDPFLAPLLLEQGVCQNFVVPSIG